MLQEKVRDKFESIPMHLKINIIGLERNKYKGGTNLRRRSK